MPEEIIWMVSAGDYSEYRPLFAVADEATADSYAEILNASGKFQYDPAFVESFPVLETEPKLVLVHSLTWMYWEGREHSNQSKNQQFNFTVPTHPTITYRFWSEKHPFPYGIDVKGVDLTVVRKIVDEFTTKQRAIGYLYNPDNWVKAGISSSATLIPREGLDPTLVYVEDPFMAGRKSMEQLSNQIEEFDYGLEMRSPDTRRRFYT